jgi:hypothetical protein
MDNKEHKAQRQPLLWQQRQRETMEILANHTDANGHEASIYHIFLTGLFWTPFGMVQYFTTVFMMND